MTVCEQSIGLYGAVSTIEGIEFFFGLVELVEFVFVFGVVEFVVPFLAREFVCNLFVFLFALLVKDIVKI